MPRLLFALSLTLALTPSVPADPPVRLGGTAWRHPERPLCLAFAPDGTWFVTGGADGTLRAWDANTGAQLRAHKVADGIATAAAVSADGKVLVAHFADEKARVLDPLTFREVRQVESPNVYSLALSADGSLFLGTSAGGRPVLLETKSGLERMELPDSQAAALFADGSAVAVADAVGKVVLLEIPSGKPRVSVAHPGKDGATGVAISADGKRFATAGSGPESRVHVWDAATGKAVADWAGVSPVAFVGPDQVACRVGGRVSVREAAGGRPVWEFDAGATTFAVSPNGKRLATAAGGPRVRVWDLDTGKERIAAGDDLGELGRFAAAGDELLLGTTTGLFRWKPAPDAKPVRVAGAARLPFVLAGKRFVAPSKNGLGIWDADTPTGQPTRTTPMTETVRAVAATPDGEWVAVGMDPPGVTVIDSATGQVTAEWTSPGAVLDITISPDGKRVVVLGRDGFARAWDAADGKPSWSARIPRSLVGSAAFSTDGRFVAVTSVSRITLLDPATGKTLQFFERKWEDGPYLAAAVSPDGRLVVGGVQGSGGAATVWEVATRTAVRRFVGGSGSARQVGFLAGGRQVVALAADDSVTVWDLTGRTGKPAPTDAELAAAWDALDRLDAAEGYPGVWTLAAGGLRAADVIRAGLADAGATDRKIAALVADLGAPAYRTRDAAGKQLAGYGLRALGPLTTAAEAHADPEVRARANDIMGRLKVEGVRVPDRGPYGETLRRLRAVAALEAIGGRAAAAVLEDLRKQGGDIGEEAARALARIRR